MTEAEFRALALALPGAGEGFSMGSTFFKVNGKVLARLLGNDRAMLTGIGPDEGDMLVEADPATFHATPHYRDARCLLVHLHSLESEVLRGFLERRFREIATKAGIREWDAIAAV